jgi:hypothetical protein
MKKFGIFMTNVTSICSMDVRLEVHKENFPESANFYKQMLKKNLGLKQF